MRFPSHAAPYPKREENEFLHEKEKIIEKITGNLSSIVQDGLPGKRVKRISPVSRRNCKKIFIKKMEKIMLEEQEKAEKRLFKKIMLLSFFCFMTGIIFSFFYDFH